MKKVDYRIEICKHIKRNYPDLYLDAETLPKAYTGKSKIRAIVLGADPSTNVYNERFKYVFGLEKKDSKYFRIIGVNLASLGLSLDEIYVENIIQNYCKVETSRNKIWWECALIWLEYLKRELDEKFNRNVPVFASSWEIFQVLVGKRPLKNISPLSIYTKVRIIKASDNYLNRSLIGLFRHPRYLVARWPNYAAAVKNEIPKS
ncbi:MAG: hypothetical protein A2V66_14900 [Ignavibacteria bacterium RBG_13_36_8]|nr:MAG: hypothetical protein A2V66_14900 [Ignavibacteria bacterium RBG_13_36_8]